MPGKDYSSLAEAKAAGAATLNYGIFVNSVLDFVIVAFAVFLLVRQVNRMRTKEMPVAPTTRDCPFCLLAVPIKAVRCPHCTSQFS